jgi:hypothetical protein
MSEGVRLPAGSSGRQERAERILDVTAGLLLRHGYKRVTIDLLADVLHRSLEIEGQPPPDAVAALAARVSELFIAIVSVQRSQLQRACG